MYASDVTFRIGRPSVGPHVAEVLALVASGKVDPTRVGAEHPWERMPEVLTSRELKPIFVRPRTT